MTLSPLAEALAAVGDRWSLLVVAALLDGPLRNADLQEQLPGIAPNILSQRLRALEHQGLLVATPYSEHSKRFLYELTEPGRALAGALRMLGDWGARHAGAPSEPPTHAACQTPLEVRWWCPACQTPVDPEDEDAGLLYA
ncbi:MAG TPA: helix-turn-helix domain-containing protein [Solirubrobacteraceae bacterium]|jgi:DNA-binding HxlR family transcriptional regulator|nr:helix-turn-helix domain-containing protein [Solirubrobacteraceae bacterium]